MALHPDGVDGLFDILVIGDLNVDLILTGDDVSPVFGQADTHVEDATVALGGSSALVACGAARLGLRVSFAGRVGADDFGRSLRRRMASRGINVRCLETALGEKTGITVHLSQPGDRAMLSYPGTVATFRAHRISDALLRSVRHVHAGSIYIQPGLQARLPELFRRAREAGATTSLDPGWDPSGLWDSGLRDLLPFVTYLLPNEGETVRIANIPEPERAAQVLAREGPTVVVKRGARGALVATPQGSRCFRAFPVLPVETTGAGDAFDAGFLFARLREGDMDESVRWGMACGALAVQAVGGFDGQPAFEEVERFLARADAPTGGD